MQLEKQVCSLDLAKRLKELGVKQESLFVWYTNDKDAQILSCPDGMRPMEQKTYSAFTVAELGEMLPKNLKPGGNWKLPMHHHTTRQDTWINAVEPQWACYYSTVAGRNVFHIEHANTEADARAKMLIYLIGKKLIGD